MKKTIFVTLLMIFTLSATTTFANNKDLKSNTLATTESKLSTEEMSRITKRVIEIRDMDKSNLTVAEKSELRKELKAAKKNIRKDSPVVYIGGTTLLLIIILILIL